MAAPSDSRSEPNFQSTDIYPTRYGHHVNPVRRKDHIRLRHVHGFHSSGMDSAVRPACFPPIIVFMGGSVERRPGREGLSTGDPPLDVAVPKAWRRFVPSWFRTLVWVDSSQSYDAFLSYSWKSDLKIAPVIQSIIQRFLCPWYKLRAKTVFRDLSCLPAGSSLKTELINRLDRSTHLVVLASPEAAHGVGMETEANHWLSRHRDGQILIIVTAGEGQAWEEISKQLLPPSISTGLTDSPLWVCLQRRRASILNNPNRPQLREELVEDLKQVLLRFYPGRDWGELRGEERSQRRRAVGLLAGFALLLLLLAATAVGFAWYAQRQRLVAESRALAAQAEQIMARGDQVRDQPEALALAIRGWNTAKTAEANLAVAHAFPELLAELAPAGQAAFSPDGQRIVTGGWDKTARVWNASNGQLLAKLEGHSDSVTQAAFSPDGQRIVTGSWDKTARVWNASNGQTLARLQGHTDKVVHMAFSPDGHRIVTASWDRTARVWNADDGKLLVKLEGRWGQGRGRSVLARWQAHHHRQCEYGTGVERGQRPTGGQAARPLGCGLGRGIFA